MYVTQTLFHIQKFLVILKRNGASHFGEKNTIFNNILTSFAQHQILLQLLALSIRDDFVSINLQLIHNFNFIIFSGI